MCGLLSLYNTLLTDSEKKVLYYDAELVHEKFEDLDIDDIVEYFRVGGKENCIPEEVKDFFKRTTTGQKRVAHVFSVYLLGIYLYDNVPAIKKSFNSFITKKIWPKTHEYDLNNNTQKRKDFLYLWYLTALFHDIGYLFENEGDNDNSKYSIIINSRKMTSAENLNTKSNILGIPKKLRYTATEYFWLRRNNTLFHTPLCADHGFVGGYLLYKELEKIHSKKDVDDLNQVVHPTNDNNLIRNPRIFKWYNVPSTWAIICHNIWISFEGGENESKYEQYKLQDLIFSMGHSPINLKNHPLLFLLDFTDTLDPLKRFCFHEDGKDIKYDCLENISMAVKGNSLSLCLGETTEEDKCTEHAKILEKLKTDLSFLESPSFSIESQTGEVIFSF